MARNLLNLPRVLVTKEAPGSDNALCDCSPDVSFHCVSGHHGYFPNRDKKCQLPSTHPCMSSSCFSAPWILVTQLSHLSMCPLLPVYYSLFFSIVYFLILVIWQMKRTGASPFMIVGLHFKQTYRLKSIMTQMKLFTTLRIGHKYNITQCTSLEIFKCEPASCSSITGLSVLSDPLFHCALSQSLNQ